VTFQDLLWYETPTDTHVNFIDDNQKIRTSRKRPTRLLALEKANDSAIDLFIMARAFASPEADLRSCSLQQLCLFMTNKRKVKHQIFAVVIQASNCLNKMVF
jgi:hypothetical protein